MEERATAESDESKKKREERREGGERVGTEKREEMEGMKESPHMPAEDRERAP